MQGRHLWAQIRSARPHLRPETATLKGRGLTESCNDLGFHAKLRLETAGNVRDVAATVRSDVRRVTDRIVHVAGCMEEYEADAEDHPESGVRDDEPDPLP